MRRLVLAGLAAGLAGCVSVDVHDVQATMDASHALASTHVRECPAARTQANARSGGETQRVGVEEVEIARTPMAGEDRFIRTRRLVIQPGGVLPWHAHDARQGMAIILSGEMTEYRNNCLDPIVYRAGDVARETPDLAHMWRNESHATATILAVDVVR